MKFVTSVGPINDLYSTQHTITLIGKALSLNYPQKKKRFEAKL